MKSKKRGLYFFKKVRRFIWRKVIRSLVLKWENQGRYIVEKKIFPSIKNKKVLLVGVEDYVSDYPKKASKNQNDVYSIDIDPEMAEFGARKHIIGDIAEIDKHFAENFLDIIFLGGVFGYGLNDPKKAEKALKNCYKVLKKRGVLIIWWKNVPGRNQVVPKRLKNYKLFTLISLAGIKSGYKAKEDVIFEFLMKK